MNSLTVIVAVLGVAAGIPIGMSRQRAHDRYRQLIAAAQQRNFPR